jgi:hypothetical protein
MLLFPFCKASKALKAGDYKKLNLPFENRLTGLPADIRARMVKAVEDFVYNMLVNVLNAKDTAPLAIEAILKAGCTNFRLGGQSCIFSYMADGIGEMDPPKPNVDALTELLASISKLEGIEVLHTDNANPAVISEHPKEAREVTKAIAEHCTSGNVLAFGLESADPRVAVENNLNASAEQTLNAIIHFSFISPGSRKDPINSATPVISAQKEIKTSSVLVATSGHNILPIPGPKKVRTPAKIPTTPSIRRKIDSSRFLVSGNQKDTRFGHDGSFVK